MEVDARVIIKLGEGRVNENGFLPNEYNYCVKTDRDGIDIQELTKYADNLCEAFNKLFDVDLDYELIMSTSKNCDNNRRNVVIQFID